MQESADATFYGQLSGAREAGRDHLDGGTAIIPLQQRMEARQSLTDEQREATLRSKRLSGQVASVPPPIVETADL